ncbi:MULTISPECIES: hypothetical protein [Halobacterium]|uniref:hypothetical protein n=1 Tax=Halobacterium TaxID=2239 RepID=UPI0019661234|nr:MULTISPECIES: hypothetical protein [Halobacterium]MCF2239616.1 hypothetical protein [Halobacterium salinarum]MDL0137820.1 hypothetical protein [Halobacterium salinarum]QRY22253.1 hypothetical protein JT689_09510 [Halobacterium sp. GSL-19]QRY24330.1 hypothetical protein JRZ79_07890 [Halobacterium sp. BOL4-2]WJK63625.1 hypothetical protein QSJ49_10530 [Halobacterium salinarum]
MAVDASAAREHVCTAHADVLAAVGAAADAVDAAAASSGPQLGAALESRLTDRGVLASLPGVLAAAVAAAGGELPAEPVAAPPYVVVTGRGPVLRATLDAGRLVVELRVFALTDANRYERRDGVAVEASVR